jgi:hypothetical protein
MLDHSLFNNFSPDLGVSARPPSQDYINPVPFSPSLSPGQDDHPIIQNLRREGGLFVADARLWKWLLRFIEEIEGAA